MTWQRLPRIYQDIATELCTEKELDALALHIAGWSERAISIRLRITRRAVRDRLDSATLKISQDPRMPRETECA